MKKAKYTLVAVLLVALVALAVLSIPGLGFRTASDVAAQEAPTATPAVTNLSNAPEALAAMEGTLEQIYNNVSPSVVSIQVIQQATGSQASPEFPGSPFGIPNGPQQILGSGFVWDSQGHIVTNYHVVEGASNIAVAFQDGTTVAATIVGTDVNSDLAVLQVDANANHLQPVQRADSSQLKVGQLAIAIGNPFGLEGTMTVGIVSALGRTLPVQTTTFGAPTYSIPDVIQTDAPINPGNSGGVLVNDQGQLIGVTAAIESPVQANAGIGFAIPEAIVEKVVPSLIDTGTYNHPWLGISGTTLSPDLADAMNLPADTQGVLVVDITPGGPADQAGLQGSDRQVDIGGLTAQVGGDVITAIDGQPVTDFTDLVTYLARNTSVGDTVTLTILRGGQQQTLDVTLQARPQETVQTTQPETQSSTTGTGSAWLGILGMDVTQQVQQAMNLPADQQGVLVVQVVQGSPADKAGMQGSFKPVTINGQSLEVGGDVIVALNGQDITGMQDLAALLQQAKPGDAATITVLRGGDQVQLDVTLGERPASVSP